MNSFVRNIAVDFILTILTCGLFNFYIQYEQCRALNDMLKEERYSFIQWLLLSLITCGLYHIYHEYKKSTDIATVLGKDGGSAGLISVVLTLFGLMIVCDAIQQSEINHYYGNQQV